MSVIMVADGCMAADRQITVGNTPVEQAKIQVARIKGMKRKCIVGQCGPADKSQQMFNWLISGAAAADFPADIDEGQLVVLEKKRCLYYNAEPVPTAFGPDLVMGFGSGAEFAMGAYEATGDIIGAVEAAIALDVCCGMGIDILRAEDL